MALVRIEFQYVQVLIETVTLSATSSISVNASRGHALYIGLEIEAEDHRVSSSYRPPHEHIQQHNCQIHLVLAQPLLPLLQLQSPRYSVLGKEARGGI